jgi:hypothetical protein
MLPWTRIMPERTCANVRRDMRLELIQKAVLVPGARATPHKARERICPRCDDFEEADPEESEAEAEDRRPR